MALINTSVPNLIQGVSQQPDATRFDGQCEEQENALSSVADGLKKRPNTRHVAKLLEEAISEDSFVHFINRNESEKYVVIHDGSKLRAYNTISGAEATINGSTGGLTISLGDYLSTDSPINEIKGLTVADSTLLLNNSQTVAPKTTKTAELSKEALVYIAQGDYSKTYQVDVEITTAGAAPTPVTTTLPTLSITLARYIYSQSSYRNRQGTTTTYYYRWRIDSAIITDAGANILSDLEVSLSSNKSVYEMPSIQILVANQVAVGANLLKRGDFEGINSNDRYKYGDLEPTISHSISGGGSLSSGTRFAKIESTATDASTTSIANLLNTEMGTGQDATNGGGFNDFFTKSRPNNGNSIYLSLTDPAQHDFSITTTDALANTGMKSIYREVDSISSLPAENKNGFKVKVKGDPELSEDDYYVEFSTNQGQAYGSGSYIETVGGGIVSGVDASTLPHQLINDGVDSFTFGEVVYADRVVGDDNSNPLPSFTGSEINSLQKNRKNAWW